MMKNNGEKMKKIGFILTNFLTILRLLGIILLIPLVNYGSETIVFYLVIFCFLTDFLDGFMARLFKCSTFFGSLLDGLSDKLFVIVNLLILVTKTKLAILVIICEFLIFIVQKKKFDANMNIKSNILGKIKMWVAGLVISVSYIYKGNFYYLFVPLIVLDFLVLLSYVREYKSDKPKRKTSVELPEVSMREFLFCPEFYEKYKNHDNLKVLSHYFKRGIDL